MNYITTKPFSRNNEDWADNTIDCSPPGQQIQHAWISEPQRPGKWLLYQEEFYKKIAVDIVTESVYNYPYPFISEKTIRPIACKRMFIIIGSPGTVELLHRKGFETFSDVIDESYDSIIDPVDRWHALERTISNFVTKPIDEIRNIVQLKSQVLDNNFLILKNLQKLELKQLNDTNS
jgi:hypothetical protein